MDKIELTPEILRNLLLIAYRRFKSIPKSELKNLSNYSINIQEELKPFFRTSGNRLTQEEIQNIQHFIEKIYNSSFDKITFDDLYEMFIANLYFAHEFPQNIIYEVFQHYFNERDEKIEPIKGKTEKELNLNKISDFLLYYPNYFQEKERDFILDEIEYLSEKFSIDAFTNMIFSLRRYNPS